MLTPDPIDMPRRITRYPRRCFSPLPRRPLATLDDRLLAYVMARLTPSTKRPPGSRATVTGPAGAKCRRPSLREATRDWSDLLGIWRQCAEPRCRFKGRCRGDALACLPRYLPRLPHSTRFWFACIGVAAENDTNFAEALVMTESQDERATCTRWQRVIDRVLTGTGPRSA